MTNDYEPLPWQKGLGYKVAEDRCRAEVHDGFGAGFHQCSRNPKPGERYCGQHMPEAVEARRKASDEAYYAKRERERLRNVRLYGKPLIDALREIANGHNDPRTLARDTLEREVQG